jgi:hypothetical protein
MVGRPGKYQPRFTAGELDPLLAGNTDEAAYLKGAQLMQNVRVLPQGGFTTVWGTKSLGAINPGAPSAPLGNVKVFPFTHSRAESYDLAFSGGNIDVFDSAGYVVSFAAPFTSAQVPNVDWTQQIDTAIVCHQQVQPWRIVYNSRTSWSTGNAPFVNIPNYDFADGTYTNGVAAVWAISFFNLHATSGGTPGDSYYLSVNGVNTVTAVYSGVTATETANILALISAIPEVAAGITVTAGPGTTPGGQAIASGQFGIEFSGANNIGDGWAVSGVVAGNPTAAITSAHIRQGVLPGEPIISSTRGWPACGAIWNQRILLAGMPGVPNAILASEATNLFNFDTRLAGASAPMLIPLDVDGAATILRLQAGQTLYGFLDSQEVWFFGSALDATATPSFPKATKNGIAPTTTPIVNEGKTIYADSFGGALYEYSYNLQVQNYESVNLTERSSTLVSNIVDMAWRGRTGATNTNEVHMVRSDGMGVTGHLLRSEEIVAFTRRVTDGSFLAVSCNARRETTWVTQRLVGNAPKQFVERETVGTLLDQAVSFSLFVPGKTVTGLSALEGAKVWAIADGYPQGPFVVSGGQITLGFAASAGYVGRWTPPRVKTVPQPRDIAPRTVMRRPCRIHTVRLMVQNTSSIAIGANGSVPLDVDLSHFGTPTDVPLLSSPFTGEVVVEGLQGFSINGVVEITQVRPGLMTVLGLTVEVDL